MQPTLGATKSGCLVNFVHGVSAEVRRGGIITFNREGQIGRGDYRFVVLPSDHIAIQSGKL